MDFVKLEGDLRQQTKILNYAKSIKEIKVFIKFNLQVELSSIIVKKQYIKLYII